MTTAIKYGNHEFAIASLPEASTLALLQRGLTHYLGNEQASKLASWVKGESQANSEDRDVCRAWKEANPEAVKAKNDELVAEAVKAVLEGKIGFREPGAAKATPLDAMIARIAKAEVLTILTSAGIKAPKKDEKVKFANGTEKSLAEMIATRIEKEGERITAEAKKAIAAEAKKREAIASSVDANDLGL